MSHYLSPIQDGPLEVCFGYPRWFGNYVFEDRHEAKDFAEFWDADMILEEDGEALFTPMSYEL